MWRDKPHQAPIPEEVRGAWREAVNGYKCSSNRSGFVGSDRKPSLQNSLLSLKDTDPILRSFITRTLQPLQDIIRGARTVNEKDENGHAPLHRALIKNSPVWLKLLLSGADIHLTTSNSGHSPLQLAALKNNVSAIQWMEYLNYSTFQRRDSFIEYKNRQNNTALHLAAKAGAYEAAECLIHVYGANTEVLGYAKKDPFEVSKSQEIKALIIRERARREPPRLHKVLLVGFNNAVERCHVMEEQIKDHGGIEKTDRQGNTVLHEAARLGMKEVVKLLLEKGARTDVLNIFCEQPWDLAQNYGQHGVIKVLKEHENRTRSSETQTTGTAGSAAREGVNKGKDLLEYGDSMSGMFR